jgi:hypothetical protein
VTEEEKKVLAEYPPRIATGKVRHDDILPSAPPQNTVSSCSWIWANSKQEQTMKFPSSLSSAAEWNLIPDFSNFFAIGPYTFYYIDLHLAHLTL